MDDVAAASTNPDPSTQTTPISTSTEVAPTEWDHLDSPEDDRPDDRLEFNEDREEREAGDGSQESGEETTATPTTETPTDEKPTETTPEATPEAEPEVEALKEKAEHFDAFDQALRTDPTSVAKAIIDGMDVLQKTAFLKALVPQAEIQAFDLAAYEPQGEMETALKQRWEHLDSIPTLAKELQTTAQSVEKVRADFIPHISEAAVQSQVANYRLDALCEALGISIPEPDAKLIEDALKDGRSTYRTAVRKAVDYKKAIEEGKQSRAPRPRTPANDTKLGEPIPEGTSMLEIARRMGTVRR